jgi:hypothetical protein
MAGTRRKEVAEKDLTGLKYFDELAPLLARLHGDARRRDKAGNRLLHFGETGDSHLFPKRKIGGCPLFRPVSERQPIYPLCGQLFDRVLD